jgi:presenilin-like A22 family membrane protease
MKHNMKITIELLIWTAFGLVFGFLATPGVIMKSGSAMPVSPLTYVILIVTIMLVSAWIWLKLFKKFKPDTLVAVFSGGIGAIMFRAITAIFSLRTTNYVIADIALQFIMIYVFGFTVYGLVKHMQKSWKNVQKWYPVMNLVMAMVIPVVAVIMSKGVPIWAAMLLLFLISCYDAYAVWKSKHMIVLAKTFMKLRILPGIVVPYKIKDRFAVLGGGDVFFISFVSAAAYPISWTAALAVVIGGFAAILWLFFVSAKKKFYPAIPFIFGGISIALILWGLL